MKDFLYNFVTIERILNQIVNIHSLIFVCLIDQSHQYFEINLFPPTLLKN